MKLVTYKEAATFLGIPVSTMYALKSRDRLPRGAVIVYGPRFVRFDLEKLKEYVEECRGAENAKPSDR